MVPDRSPSPRPLSRRLDVGCAEVEEVMALTSCVGRRRFGDGVWESLEVEGSAYDFWEDSADLLTKLEEDTIVVLL